MTQFMKKCWCMSTIKFRLDERILSLLDVGCLSLQSRDVRQAFGNQVTVHDLPELVRLHGSVRDTHTMFFDAWWWCSLRP